MKYILVILISFLFIACQDDTSTSVNTSDNIKVAYLYDTALDGVEYRCGNDITGITGNANSNSGSFFYKDTCDVEFFIGKIYLGKVPKEHISNESKVYPTNLLGLDTTDTFSIKLSNLLRFIQTIDEDQNTLNGITISENTRLILNNSNVNAIDFTNINLSEESIQNTINYIDSSRKLISHVKAISHFEETLRKYVDPNIDTVPPEKPYLTNPVSYINNKFTKSKEFEVNGENNTKIFVAFNSDGNESNLNFIDYNTTITNNEKANITLNFDNDNISYFHYFIRLQDDRKQNSDYYKFTVLKDDNPPYIVDNNISVYVNEEQKLLQNVNARDISKITYKILTSTEDNRSIDYSLFQIDVTGLVTFKVEPNFEEDKKFYNVVVRTFDEAGNYSDVLINVSLINLLDNPPALTNTNYSKNIIETTVNDTFVYDLNNTLKSIDEEPDNIFPIRYVLNNHTDIFDLNLTSGILTIKDASDDFFDYEKNISHTMDLNISAINDNDRESGNTTNLTLTITIDNKIDTAPKLISPSDVSILEHKNTSVYDIITIQKDTILSDKDLSMAFDIIDGDDDKFTINSNGTIEPVGDVFDFETKNKYILTIRATNIWFDGTTHSDDVNLTINITNVIDNAPIIKFINKNQTIPESTDANITVATVGTNGTNIDENTIESYNILTSNIPFTINSTTGEITTTRQLLNDYIETDDNNSMTQISFNIVAKNKWWNSTVHNSNGLVLDINISNVIDNAPEILQPETQNIDENVTDWSLQIQTNGDIYDKNTTTSFRIVSGADDKFEIDNNGLITLKNSLDWETKNNYQIVIDANNTWKWDNNTQHTSNPVTLNIAINNIIEKAPKIYTPSTIYVHENTDGQTILSILDINSTELDERSIDSFSITSGNDGNFSIKSKPLLNNFTNNYYGELKLTGNENEKGNLDFDIKDSYDINITATNSFGTSDPKTIHVNIIDDINTNLNLLVILIEYSDINISTSYPDIENLIFTNGSGSDKYLANYFSRVSKNKFTFKAAKESYDTSPASNGIVKVTLSSNNHPTSSVTQLKEDIIDALNIADDNVTFSNFDKNSDGIITSDELQVLYIVAGGERAYGDENQSINAITGAFEDLDEDLTLDDIKIKTNYTAVGELIHDKPTTIGLIAKLLSEKLFGFKQDGNSNFNYNYFDIMGDGYQGHEKDETLGRTPVHPSIYNKMKQGWVIPKLLIQNETIDFFNTHDEVFFNALRVNTNDEKIYYLIENRNQANGIGDKINYDDGLYGKNEKDLSGGLIIWKIDENIPNIKIVQINNSKDPNIFNTSNSTGDLNIDQFEFNDQGSIDTDTKRYNIGINKK